MDPYVGCVVGVGQECGGDCFVTVVGFVAVAVAVGWDDFESIAVVAGSDVGMIGEKEAGLH